MMRNGGDIRMWWLALPLMVLPLLSLGCGGGGVCGDCTPVVPPTPSVHESSIFSSSAITVYSHKPEWSPNGSAIAFEGTATGLGAWDIYAVSSTAGATPSRITNWTSTAWSDGGVTPASTSDSTLIYWVGTIGTGQNYNLMAASYGQVANVPAPSIYWSYNPADGASGAEPDGMSISGDGNKIVQHWSNAATLMDWSAGGASPVLTQITGVSQCVISREGTHIAYVKADGTVACSAIGSSTEINLEPGSDVSWASGGKLGYVVNGGYVVYVLSTDTMQFYKSSAYLENAAISWDGTKIAFRTFSGSYTGISVGYLDTW
jgi:hypothetical protein